MLFYLIAAIFSVFFRAETLFHRLKNRKVSVQYFGGKNVFIFVPSFSMQSVYKQQLMEVSLDARQRLSSIIFICHRIRWHGIHSESRMIQVIRRNLYRHSTVLRFA